MLYVMSALLSLFGVIRSRSRIIFFLMSILLIFLLGGSLYNSDRLAYEQYYYGLKTGTSFLKFEIGFELLCRIALFFGFSFQILLFIIAIAGMVLIGVTIKKFTPNITVVLVLYLIYPFILETVQIRNFIAASIIIFAFQYIVAYEKNFKKYFILVIIASLFHTSALIYFAAYLIQVRNTKKMFYTVLLITILSIILFPLMVDVLSLFTTSEKVIAYTTTSTSYLTKFVILIYFAISLLLVKYSIKIVEANDARIKGDLRIKNVSTYQRSRTIKPLDTAAIMKINIMCMMVMCFLLNNLNFIRVYRNVFLLNYILFSICMVLLSKDKKVFYFLAILIYTIITCILFTVLAYASDVIKPFFENNILLEWWQIYILSQF